MSGKNIKKRVFEILPVMCFLVMTFCIFMPSSLFLGNKDEFAIDYIKIVPILAVTSLIVMAVMLLISVFLANEKAHSIYVALMFGLTLGLYVQGNFLNPKFSVLNGDEIDWSSYTMAGIISVVAWIACLVIPQILVGFKKMIAARIMKWGSWLLTLMQLSTLMVLVLSSGKTIDNSFALTKKDEFVISENKNVIVFVVDTLDATWAEKYILSDSHYSNQLKDFTYFDNAVSGGAPTLYGIPTMLTGVTYDTNASYSDYTTGAYEKSTLFRDLQAADYDVKLYTDYSYLDGADIENVNNIESDQEYEISSNTKFAKSLYRLTSFYSMPQLVKKYFWFYGNELSECVTVKDRNLDLYHFDDPQFYKDMCANDLKTQKDKNVFVMYHLFGSHGPYSMDENAQLVDASKTSEEQQTKGSFKIVCEYMDSLKALGKYDDSTIIITADHGGEDLYQNPAIFIKNANVTQNSVVTNSDPVMFKNMRASIAAAALDDYSAYGPTLFEMAGNTEPRYHAAVDVLGGKKYPDDEYVSNHKAVTLYRINGRARDYDNVSVIYDDDWTGARPNQ